MKLKDINNRYCHTVNLHCPYCHTYCGFICFLILSDIPSSSENNRLIKGMCPSCNKTAIWLVNSEKELLLFPDVPAFAPDPNPDMPENIKQIYIEACSVLKYSPRASAALSRLAVDELTTLFSDKRTLNDRIYDMFTNGLPKQIKKSLDIVRVIGNNAVHPGEIDLSDNKNLALSLLQLINIIVQNRISEPKSIDNLHNLLPDSALKAIEKRDSE